VAALSKWIKSFQDIKGTAPSNAFKKQASNAIVVTKKYKEGGLVNYTGPAWVDGTPGNPEAFLNAD
jgi:hypothetical protein